MNSFLRRWSGYLRLPYLLVGMIGFLLLWRIPYYGKLVLDDPYITFQYAQNLIEHGQFVFNRGEYVLATTTPTYAGLMALVYALGVPLKWGALVLNLLLEILVLYVLGRILRLFDLSQWEFAAAFSLIGVLLVTNRAISIASNSGMETILFLLLNIVTLYDVVQGRYLRGAVWGSLATLTRPDGIFALLVLGIVVLYRERRLPVKPVLLSMCLALPWVVVATLTYGSPIPHSVIAKSAISDIWFTTLSTKLSVIFYEPLRYFGIFLFPGIVVAVWRGGKQPVMQPFLVFGGFHLIYVMLPDNLGFDWYFAPLYFIIDLIAVIGLVWLVRSRETITRLLVGVCVAGIAVGIVYSSVGNYLSVRQIDRIWHQGMLRAIALLQDNAAPDAVVQSTNIGILAYETDFIILDTLGLSSPAVVPVIEDAANLRDLKLDVARAFTPDFIVSFGTEDYAGYTQMALFDTDDVAIVVYRYANSD